jgi:ferric iron reductase protein FhuF
MRAASISFDRDFLFKHYRITIHETGNSRISFSHSPLRSVNSIHRLIDHMGDVLGTRDKAVAGSIFIKRYSALITGALYLWTHHSFTANLALDRVSVQIEDSGLLFGISNQTADDGEQFLRHLFADNACRVLEAVAKYTKVPESTLWAHLSYLLVYRFEEWLRNATTAARRERLHAVYHRIIYQPSADWFPEKTKIPLIGQYRSVEDPLIEGNKILIRSKCCLSYRLPGEDRYCYTCPLISDVCRIEKYKAMHGSD